MNTVSTDSSARHTVATTDLAAKLAALTGLAVGDLRAEWRRLYPTPPPKKVGRYLLELGVAWKLQERVHGGLSAAMKRRLADLATTMDEDGDLAKTRAVRLKPGAKLVRQWRGETHDVLVLEHGFQWHGRQWRSLSTIAREITGARWSGPRFFGLHAKAAGGTKASARQTCDA